MSKESKSQPKEDASPIMILSFGAFNWKNPDIVPTCRFKLHYSNCNAKRVQFNIQFKLLLCINKNDILLSVMI